MICCNTYINKDANATDNDFMLVQRYINQLYLILKEKSLITVGSLKKTFS